MTENLKRLLDFVQSGQNKGQRRELSPERFAQLQEAIVQAGPSLSLRAARRLSLFLAEETTQVLPFERIVGRRSLTVFPDIYLPGEREALQSGHYVHEQGRVCNISSDWGAVLREGLWPRRERALQTLRESGQADADFLRAAVETIDAVTAFCDRWADALHQSGQAEAGKGLRLAVRCGAQSFRDALQLFRLLHFCLWASNVYHNTVGRFDQYMLPFLQADLACGLLDEDAAQDLLEEFFLSFNRDSDLYQGMQQGDNGQSLMLGGCDADGACAVNQLTAMCLKASLHLGQIDPKINLRVDKNTPLSLYELGAQLTRQGLGFPQYANDDVVIPGLVRLGYALEDARNYTVAACWEFIIPGVAMDIPNIAAMPLAGVVDGCIRRCLAGCQRFEELLQDVREAIFQKADELLAPLSPLFLEPASFQSVLMDGCLERGQDISKGAKYNNYGVHGTGFSQAVDQLLAVKALVFEGDLAPERLLRGMETAFADDAELLYTLRNKAPKLGRDEEALPLADELLGYFADSLRGRTNERGGCFRPGTGSAMYYLWHADELGALADGRLPGEPLAANFSPSLALKDAGPLSVLRAFARPKVLDTINGGPLTLELHDTVFRGEEGLTKVAMLVKGFIDLGGHQLQLNTVNHETLLDAQAHPERHENLIVRVWGWSGRFVLLDKAYQDQIIARTAYGL